MKKIAIVLVIVVIFAIMVGIKYYNSKMNATAVEDSNYLDSSNDENNLIEEPTSAIKIFNGKYRPIAFMIDNNINAWPQASINSAYIVYEMIVEGGETRLMAIFKNVVADEVGPIRSARHYFLDYAMENDAIYAHLGTSPQADKDMELYDINHMNGQVYDTGGSRTETSLYWRVNHKKAPHNAYTNTDSILKIAKDKGYTISSDKKSVLNYVEDEVDLNYDNSITADEVIIPYSTGNKVQYKYNLETKRYLRYSKKQKITDEISREDTEIKNIIITFAKNYNLKDIENKGRQEVVTVGELDGYYITNGKAIKIKCIKTDRKEQTVYKDLNGNEIKVNDGNTWVNICPIDAKVVIQ